MVPACSDGLILRGEYQPKIGQCLRNLISRDTCASPSVSVTEAGRVRMISLPEFLQNMTPVAVKSVIVTKEIVKDLISVLNEVKRAVYYNTLYISICQEFRRYEALVGLTKFMI